MEGAQARRLGLGHHYPLHRPAGRIRCPKVYQANLRKGMGGNVDEIPDARSAGHTGAIEVADGAPTPIYHALKSLNLEFAAIANEFQPLRSLGVSHTGMTPPSRKTPVSRRSDQKAKP